MTRLVLDTNVVVAGLADGLVRLMNSPDDFTGPVNLGNPGEFTILELAKKVIALTGSKSAIAYKPLPADDPTQRKPDIALAKRVLDWTPRVALDDGLTQAIAYFRDSGGGAACSSLTSACSDWATLPPASSATWTKSRRSPAPQWTSFKFIKGDIRKLDDCRRDDEEDYLRARWQVQA